MPITALLKTERDSSSETVPKVLTAQTVHLKAWTALQKGNGIVIYWCLVTFNHKQRFSEKISRKNLYNKSHGRCTVTINGKIQEVKTGYLLSLK